MTLLIVLITALISYGAFQRHDIFDKLLLSPYRTFHQHQWYRMITHGFVHADWIHLIINMLVLFSFGRSVENIFLQLEGYGIIGNGKIIFVLLYLSGLIVASLSSLLKHKDNPGYRSVGASGAVAAIVFTHIFFQPWSKLYFWAILPIPGIVFGLLYLGYSHYMSRKPGHGNINHDAHFYGAVYGLVFPLLLELDLINTFLEQIFPG